MLASLLALALAPTLWLPQGPAQQIVCVPGLKDAAGGGCIHASTNPTFGMLFPLGPEFFVDAFGNVGIGTTNPLFKLDVQGRIRTTGGIEFPDGSAQTSALMEGEQGPAGPTGPIGPTGPPGPLVPPLPTAAIGTVDLTGLGCNGSHPVYELSFENTGVLGNFLLTKAVDTCTTSILGAIGPPSTVIPLVELTLGQLRIRLESAQVSEVDVVAAPDTGSGNQLPREQVQIQALKVTWEWTGTNANTTSWEQFSATATGSNLAGVSLLCALPEVDALGANDVQLLDGAMTTRIAGEIELVKTVDQYTPGAWLSVIQNAVLGASTAEFRNYSPGQMQDVASFGMTIGAPLIEKARFDVHPVFGLTETWTLSYASLSFYHEKL